MKFTDKQLEEFKEIYKDKFGEELSDADALKYATKLIATMKVIHGLDID